jgi:coenzyme F420-0:L-glutamate ligase/coenzyme F420-1:gamma-L-glutamate ligase
MSQAEIYLNFLRSRRSVRHFLPEPVPDEVVKRMLETAAFAPSAHNRQPWRFVIPQSGEAKTRLAEQMGKAFRIDLMADGLSEEQADAQVERSRQRILEAPLVVILCLDSTEMDIYPDEKRRAAEYIMAVQSVALAGGTLLLSAHAEGLGGVWVCAPLFAPEAVRQALDMPDGWEPQGMLLMGAPAKFSEFRSRRAISEVSRFI